MGTFQNDHRILENTASAGELENSGDDLYQGFSYGSDDSNDNIDMKTFNQSFGLFWANSDSSSEDVHEYTSIGNCGTYNRLKKSSLYETISTYDTYPPTDAYPMFSEHNNSPEDISDLHYNIIKKLNNSDNEDIKINTLDDDTQTMTSESICSASASTSVDTSVDTSVETKKDTAGSKRRAITKRGHCGFINQGNTCYMNSILQCLNSVNLLRAWLRHDKFYERLRENALDAVADEIKKEKKMSSGELIKVPRKDLIEYCNNTITYRLSELFKKMWEQNRSIKPLSMKKVISEKNDMFKGYLQHDSQELLNCIIDSIHEEVKRETSVCVNDIPKSVIEYMHVKSECERAFTQEGVTDDFKKQIIDYYNEYRKEHMDAVTFYKACVYWTSYLSTNDSIISDLFTGLYYSRIICEKCGMESPCFEHFTMMSLQIKDMGETTLDDCLTNFSKEELLTSDNKYDCTMCGVKTDAKKKMLVWAPPPVLIIHLKRFKNEFIRGRGWQQLKTHTLIKFPITGLTLDNNYSDIHRPDGVIYDLYAVSEHMGTRHAGHYTASCKNSLNGLWYKFDDNNVSHIPTDEIEETVVTRNAYLLVYIQRKAQS